MRKLTIKPVFVAFCVINILAIAILGITIQRRSLDLAQTINLQALVPESEPNITSPSYKFDDPFTAYTLLEQLDIFETVKDGEIKANYTKKVNGLLPNNHYCEEHRAYFVSNPEFLFENIHIITNYWRSNKLRTQVIPMVGKDIHTEISSFRNSRNIDMRLDASMFIMWNLYFGKRQIGKQFSCLSQASNHIPGHDNLYKKDAFNLALVDYIEKYESKPECLDFTKYFPKTWVLKEKEHCLSFFEEFKSEKYQQLKKERNIVYFRKIGANVHEGRGVFPINDAEEDKLMKLYKNGTKCGKIKKNYLIQYNVHNLLLITNRKFGFRMFMLVASTNPLLAYFHDGYARLSLNEYDAMSNEVNTFVTNINLNKKASTNLTKQEIEDFTLWLLEDVQEYLLEEGLIHDPNWLDNYLRPEFKKVMVHLLRVSQSGFFQKSSLFCLFGLDFVLDEHLGLWFIETNAKPLISGSTEGSIRVLNQMLVDMIEIVMGLIRSRMKRVINYVNMLTKENLNKKMEISNIEEKRQEFKQLTMNYFEPEFQPSQNNTFQKIVDDREAGVKRYMNMIKEECLSICGCSS